MATNFMTPIQLDLVTGEMLKEVGIETVEGNNENFVEIMRAEATRIASIRGLVSSDDLRAFASRNGIRPKHQNAWGAIFKGWKWKRVCRKKSELVSNHAREISVWALK